MIYPDAQVDGEFNPVRIGKTLNEGVLPRLALAAKISHFTESPIETMMGLALFERFAGCDVEIIPQLPFRRFRIDWAVRRAGKPDIFIECDGNEFHTKLEDVARDQARDAIISAAGIKIFRFTGAEIFADAERCAWNVFTEAAL